MENVSDLGDQLRYLNVYMKFVNHEENRWWCEENGVHYGCLHMAVNINGELQEILEKSLKTGVR